MMRQRLSAPAICVMLLVAAACGDASGPTNTPPTVPPTAVFALNIGLFEDSDPPPLPAGSSFASAATIAAATVTSAAFLTFAAPVATFAIAVTRDPVVIDGVHHWRTSTTGQDVYHVDVSAEPAGNEVVWEMRVSSTTHSPPLDNYLWFSGTATPDGRSGAWVLFDITQPTTRTEVLRAVWNFAAASDRSFTITNVDRASPGVGDKLEFAVSGNLSTVRFTDVSGNDDVLIQWNIDTLEGFIEAPLVNGGSRGCWNSLLQNVTCQ